MTSTDLSTLYDGAISLPGPQTSSPAILITPSSLTAIAAMRALDITQELDYDAIAKLCDDIAAGVRFA